MATWHILERFRSTTIIDFVAVAYGACYSPNTRETVRDEALKYFTGAGMLLQNPDDSNRAPNSAKTAYEIEPAALELGDPTTSSVLAANILAFQPSFFPAVIFP